MRRYQTRPAHPSISRELVSARGPVSTEGKISECERASVSGAAVRRESVRDRTSAASAGQLAAFVATSLDPLLPAEHGAIPREGVVIIEKCVSE